MLKVDAAVESTQVLKSVKTFQISKLYGVTTILTQLPCSSVYKNLKQLHVEPKTMQSVQTIHAFLFVCSLFGRLFGFFGSGFVFWCFFGGGG